MATFLRKLWHHFGRKDDSHRRQAERPETSRGFGVKMAVQVEHPIHVPVVAQTYGNGGVQHLAHVAGRPFIILAANQVEGLRWYAEKLRVDDDGDVAQEFLSEVVSEDENSETAGRLPRLEAVVQTRPVVLKGPVCTQDGNVHQYVESSSGHSWA